MVKKINLIFLNVYKNMQKLLYSLLLIILFFNTNGSYAEESNIFKMDMVDVGFISTISKIDNNDFLIGLEFNLEPGWKIYWRQPGDSGLPPKLDFSLSKNLSSFEMQWPYPIKELEAANILTNVYKDNIIIPIKISVIDKSKTLYLDASLSFQVCKDICIPLETSLFLKLYPGKAESTDNLHRIELALSKVPKDYSKTGIKNISVSKKSKKILILNIENSIDFPSGELDIFLENKNDYIKIIKVNVLENFKKNIQAELILENEINDYKDINITLVKGNLVASVESININNSNSDNVLLILLMAFIGGFILNFMPCVLPVLSLKISRVLSNKDKSYSSVRFNFLLTTLGIISSFIFLAIVTVSLKNITGEIGWGIQFQQPVFLFFLIFVLILFSLNLFNLLAINLPGKLNTYISSYIENKKHGVAFFEGAFATLLATPCSAPFLGSAVSFALSSSFYITLCIFIVLGIGMSFPYILFIIFPSFTKFLPKPGVWMVYLKYVLGIGVMLTALWLCYVCIMIIGLSVFSVVILALILFILLLNKKFYKNKYGVLIIVSLIIGSYYLYHNKVLDKYSLFSNHNSEWVSYNSDVLSNYINNGKVVFIDITADWCVTCKVNKLLVLNSKEFQNIVDNNNLILMRGDWTKPDNAITRFLQESNRYGIPFNALYSLKYPRGYIFSELLSLTEINEGIIMHNSYAE